MTPPQVRPLPRGLALVLSGVLAAHLLAVGLLVLAAPSGPWPTPFGQSLAVGPPFAQSASEVVGQRYLRPLKMTHNYHLTHNRTGQPGAFFEVQFADDSGAVIRTLRFPDPQANFWVRHRQSVLARMLADDVPVQPGMAEAIPAPNQQARTVTIWDGGDNQALQLKTIPEHLIPRDRPVFRPSEWSLLLARSYLRHLLREHDAASARLIRHTREAVMPALLYVPEPPAEVFQELLCDFGEVKK